MFRGPAMENNIFFSFIQKRELKILLLDFVMSAKKTFLTVYME